MKFKNKILMFTILISLFLGMFFHNESFAVPDYGEPGSYNTAFSIELVCNSLKNYEIELSGDYGYETRVYSEKILDEDFYVKIASLVDMGETIETSSFGILNYIGTEEIIGRHCYIYTADITDKTIFENKIVEDLRYSEYNFKFYYEISIERKIEDIIIGNEIEDGLIESFESYEYEDWIDEEMTQSQIIQAYNFSFKPSKLINLLNNTSKLASLVQNDNYIYDYVYFRLIGEQNKAKIKYADNTEKSLEIVTINNIQYAKCPIGVIKKTDNQYYPGCFSLAGKDTSGLHCDGYICFYNNDTKIQDVRFFVGILPESYNSCSIDLQCESLTNYEIDGVGDHGCESKIYNNKIFEEDCYIKLSSDVYAGENIEVYPFGTLSYTGTEQKYGTTVYVYKMAVTNKTIFNKDVVGRVLSEQYNIIYCYEISAKEVQVEKKDINNLSVNIDISNKEYTGQEIKISIIIKDNQYILLEGTDYIVEYENNMNPGTATAIIKGQNNYKGEILRTYEIAKRDISNLIINVNTDDYIYTGETIEPLVEIICDGRVLQLKEDYEVSYENNINVGTATVTITGIGYYKGTVEKKFEIYKKSEFVYWKVCSRDYRYDYPYEYGLYEYLSKNNIDVSQVSEIIFNNVKKTENVINSNVSLDVSKNLDKSVMVYVLENKLYIQYEGILKLDNAIGLFTGFKNVTHIKGLEYIDTSEVTSMWCMFNGCESLLEIDVSSFDTSNVTNMQTMFGDCLKIKKIDLSTFNTERVQSMGFMFENNKYLEELNLNGFNTRAVTNMRSMFYNCIWLKRVDLTSFDTRNVTSMDRMFYKSGLEELDLSSFDTSKVTDMSDMFWYASSLTKIYVSKMWNVEGVSDSSSMFGGNTKLSGNNGTKYDSSIERDKTYARIDSYYTPGYLSAKIDIKSDMYNLEKDYIYISNQQFDLSKIETTNCTKVIEDNILYINYEDILIRKYYIINILSEHYDIGEDNIVVFEEDVDLDKINITNASKEILNNILYIKFQDKVVKEYKINMPYEGFVFDNTVTYNGQAYGIKLKESNPYNIKVKYADKNGNYTLTEMPKYHDAGTYKINYMLYVDNNNGTVKGYKTLTIKKANINNSSTNYEGIYDGKEHSINVKVDIPNYDIKYSINNNNYNLNAVPLFKDVGDYTINYRITSPNYNDLVGSNKVRIYGVKKLDSTLEIRNNMLIVKNYKNNFTDLCNRIQLHANSKSYLHLNQNKNVINDLLVKTGEYIQLVINNSTKLEYKVSVLADVNGDGKISALDYVKIKNHIMKTNLISSDVYLTAADVNDDGKISALDYVRIKNYIMNGGV